MYIFGKPEQFKSMRTEKSWRADFVPVALLISLLLLGVICMVHLLVMAVFILRGKFPPYIFPLSIASVMGLVFLLAGRLGIQKRQLLIASIVCLLIFALGLLVSWCYFDFSWDGQWYQQAAIYNLSENWNPFVDPLATPDHLNNPSILHFPKNSWYFGAALLRLFGTVEMGKTYNVILLFAAFGVFYALCRDLRMSVARSVTLTILVLLNPVVWSELTTFLNDGDLYLLLITYLASVMLWLRNSKITFVLISIMAGICLVNIKFTGLVFFILTSIFIFIYVLIRARKRVMPFLLWHMTATILALGLFGFNPYVTNTLKRGAPLYPLIGSKEYPGVIGSGNDDNEKYETPKNMRGKSLPVRLVYANFGRPGNAPYNHEDSARLEWPLTSDLSSWSAYDYHETRVAGFGPGFGLLLMFTVPLLPLLIAARWRHWGLEAMLFILGVCFCQSISKHFWWPRFFPMFWLLPVVPIFLLWVNGNNQSTERRNGRWKRGPNDLGWFLAVLMCVNGGIVAFIHLRWETRSSLKLRAELTQIHAARRPIVVDYGWFKRSVEEKLSHWEIDFTYGPLRGSDSLVRELPSVVEGYPNEVIFITK